MHAGYLYRRKVRELNTNNDKFLTYSVLYFIITNTSSVTTNDTHLNFHTFPREASIRSQTEM